MSAPNQAFHRHLAQSQRPQYGLWLGMASAASAEICSGCGFDWLLIDAEHGPNTLTTVLGQLRATAGSDARMIVRLPEGNAALIKQYLDIGAHTLLIPMVDDAEQAAMLASAMRYPPQGVRGLGTSMARAARWNQDSDYLATANERVSLIAQIETASGLENVEAICGSDGVDAIFIGPSDLSAALGHPGELGHPTVVAAVEKAIDASLAAGKPAGVLALSKDLAQRYAERGASFIGVGVDTVLLSQAAQALSSSHIEGKDGPASSGKY